MRVQNRKGPGDRIALGDAGAVNILEEDYVAELPAISEQPWRIFFFWPMNNSKVTIKCHGGDLIDGHEEIVIHEDKIHAILGMGGNRYHADFPVTPVAVNPENQNPKPPPVETPETPEAPPEPSEAPAESSAGLEAITAA